MGRDEICGRGISRKNPYAINFSNEFLEQAYTVGGFRRLLISLGGAEV